MAEEKKNNEKETKIKSTISQIEKQFGKNAIMRLGDNYSNMEIAVIPTGILSLDIALGIGGLPRGRIIEIYGPESSGKTTIALNVIAQAQKADGIAAFIDAEHALNPEFAKLLGVNVDELLVSQPSYGEEALEIADTLVRSGAVDIIVIDSVAALVPKAELDGDMGDSHMGLQARLMSQALRKLTGSISKSKTCVIFINQIRQKIGIVYGNPETTTGGNALKFYASIRMEVKRIETLKSAQENYGIRVRARIVKNKVAPPFKQTEFEIIFNKGIATELSLLQLAVENNLIEKSGTWYSFNGEKIGQGKDNASRFLLEHPEIMAEIEQKIREKYGLK